MEKKAQGVSINIIIIAAIGMIVLVVLIAIFSGRITIFNQGVSDNTKGTADCENDLSGSWVLATECEGTGTPIFQPLNDTKDNPGKVCCVLNTTP